MSAREMRIRCRLDLENSFDSLHAHAIPEGVEIRPGDTVLIDDAPVRLAPGARLSATRAATLRRAGPIRRAIVRATAVFALTSLYEVGFETGAPR